MNGETFTKEMIDAAIKQERDRIIRLLEWELWEAFVKSHNERPAWATMGMLIRAIKEQAND